MPTSKHAYDAEALYRDLLGQVRAGLDEIIGRLAAVRASDADIRELKALVEQMRIAGSNLGSTANGNSQDTFAAVVEALAKARRVYILGFGNSAYLAGLAAANLVPYCADAVAVSMEGGNENAAYRLASITAEDALLAISLPRYSLDTLQLARYALERGARVLARGSPPSASSPGTTSPPSWLAALSQSTAAATAPWPLSKAAWLRAPLARAFPRARAVSLAASSAPETSLTVGCCSVAADWAAAAAASSLAQGISQASLWASMRRLTAGASQRHTRAAT